MRYLMYLVLATVFFTSCSNSGTTAPGALDTSLRNIDSSKIINSTSRLPQDGTATVTQ